jgi:hypothetical protein
MVISPKKQTVFLINNKFIPILNANTDENRSTLLFF